MNKLILKKIFLLITFLLLFIITRIVYNNYQIEKLKSITKIEKSKNEYKLIEKQFNDSLYKWNKMRLNLINSYFKKDWMISDIFFNSKRNRFIMIIIKVNNDNHPFDYINLVAGEYKKSKLHFYMTGLTSVVYPREGYDQHSEDQSKKFTNKNDMSKMRNYILDRLIDGGILDFNKINDKWINDWYIGLEIPHKYFYKDTIN